MFLLSIGATEQWDNVKEEFVYTKPVTIAIEHSLVSISKWEAKWERSFLSHPPITRTEKLDYIRCMTITQNVPIEAFNAITESDLSKIEKYINAPMSATKFYSNNKQMRSNATITSELIYYWMIDFGIPFECQKWHLNRLMALIRICEMKSRKQKKQSASEILKQNNALNAQRRAMMNSRG